jgi:hypothetical protein
MLSYPEQQAVAVTVPTFAKQFDISEAKVWQLIRTGRLASFKIDRSRRIPVSEITRVREQGVA